MAKNNNLTDFLTDVADAIRAKKGSTAKINPQDFSAEIASIESGGGSGGAASVIFNDVNFFDYDGNLLHAYTKEQFLSLSAMPELPQRSGLICEGWNWSLANAKERVTDEGFLDIGANYITDDGKSRLYISVLPGRTDVPLYFNQSAANSVTVDWGDGSATEKSSTSGNVKLTHTYASPGDYVITMQGTSTYSFGNKSTSYSALGPNSNTGKVYLNMLKTVNVGSKVSALETYAFKYCTGLQRISIPKNCTKINDYAFDHCYSLNFIALSPDAYNVGAYAFNYCYSLELIALPYNITGSVGNGAFNYCYSLRRVSFPKNLTSVGTNLFQNCYRLERPPIFSESMTQMGNAILRYCDALQKIVIPKSVTTIGQNALGNCPSIDIFTFPSNLSTINSGAFNGCYGVVLYDFRAASIIPSLANANAFTNQASDFKIVVPDSLYDTWKTSTNWSTFSSYIVKASEY